MLKRNKKFYIRFAIGAAIFAFFIIPSFYSKNQAMPVASHPTSASVSILAGKQAVYLSVPPNTLLYDALAREKAAGKIEFFGKNYPGLGFFVTDIGTLHSGNGKNLIYYINSKKAIVGVSNYVLKSGDIIEWKLE